MPATRDRGAGRRRSPCKQPPGQTRAGSSDPALDSCRSPVVPWLSALARGSKKTNNSLEAPGSGVSPAGDREGTRRRAYQEWGCPGPSHSRSASVLLCGGWVCGLGLRPQTSESCQQAARQPRWCRHSPWAAPPSLRRAIWHPAIQAHCEGPGGHHRPPPGCIPTSFSLLPIQKGPVPFQGLRGVPAPRGSTPTSTKLTQALP